MYENELAKIEKLIEKKSIKKMIMEAAREVGTGLNGKDGRDGKDGFHGLDGYTPIKGIDYFDGLNGRDGKDGKNGIDGKNGRDGLNGKKQACLIYSLRSCSSCSMDYPWALFMH